MRKPIIKLNEQKRQGMANFWSDTVDLWRESLISKIYLCVSALLFVWAQYALVHRSSATKYMVVADLFNLFMVGFLISQRNRKNIASASEKNS